MIEKWYETWTKKKKFCNFTNSSNPVWQLLFEMINTRISEQNSISKLC